MSGYTKGKWEFIDVIGCCTIMAPGRQLLKCMSPTMENRANARLMATSPELLEALIGVVKVADRDTDEFIRARNAIAKATINQ